MLVFKACMFVLVFTVRICTPTKRKSSCSQDSFEYFNSTLRRCIPCGNCPIGQGRNISTNIQLDRRSRPLNCYKCAKCVQGMYSPIISPGISEYETCLDCMVCSMDNRKTLKNCTSSSNTVCGNCMDNYYDYYRELNPESDDPCRHCKFSDKDDEACKDYWKPNTPVKAVKTMKIWPTILVFSLVVGLPVMLVLIVCVVNVRKRRRAGYQGLANIRTDELSGSNENLTGIGRHSEGIQWNGVEGTESQIQKDHGPNSSSQPKQADNIPTPTVESVNGYVSGGSRCSEGLLGATPWDDTPKAMSRVSAENMGVNTDGSRDLVGTTSLPRCPTNHRRCYSESGTAVDSGNTEDIPPEYFGPGIFINGVSEETTLVCRRRFQRSISCPEHCKSTGSWDGASGSIIEQESPGQQVGAAQAEEVVSDNILEMVRDMLGPCDTRRLFRRLMDIPQADADFDYIRDDHPHNSKEVAYQALKRWKHSKGSEATEARLIANLFAIRRNDVVRELQRQPDCF